MKLWIFEFKYRDVFRTLKNDHGFMKTKKQPPEVFYKKR